LFVTEPVPLRVVLVSEEEQVGEARMAMEAEIDEERGLVLVEQGTEAMVGFILNRDTMDQVRIIVQDPQSGSVFAESDLIPVNLSI
jgi:CBS domain-containing protein